MDESRNNPLEAMQAAMFLHQAHFQFRTLQDAHIVAQFLAHTCPNARLALMGITEIFINAIEHGNLAITYDEKTELQQEEEDWIGAIEKRLNLPNNIDKYVDVYFLRTEQELQIRVVDQGQGFDWKKYQCMPAQRSLDSHGRGIMMARNLAFNRIEFSESGNEVLCVISLTAP